MSIINLSNYTEYKNVDFVDANGTKISLKIRPMSSAESLKLSSLNDKMQTMRVEGKMSEATKLLEDISNDYFNLYDDPKKARKVLEPLSFEAWFDIYKQVMEEG